MKTKAAGKEQDRVKERQPHAPAPPPRRPVLEFDYREYAHHLSQYDLTEEQKRAHLEALWRILIAFADLGFGIHPAQAACGQDGKNRAEHSLAGLFALECADTEHNDKFADTPQSVAAAESEK